MSAPPFRAEVIGSLLRPRALKDTATAIAAGRAAADDYKAVLEREIARVVAKQEELGLRVVTDGEFGRTSVMQGANGRDHSPYGFTAWMAGGGIKGGKVIGATDELGFRAVEDKVHVNDLHASLLTLLGLDHEKLTYLFEGRNRRLTDVGGHNQFAARLVG